MERLNLSCMVGYPACRKPAGSLQGLHIVAFGVPNDLAASKLCVEFFDIPCYCRPQRSEMVRRKVLAFLSSDCLCLFFLLLLSRSLALLLLILHSASSLVVKKPRASRSFPSSIAPSPNAAKLSPSHPGCNDDQNQAHANAAAGIAFLVTLKRTPRAVSWLK